MISVAKTHLFINIVLLVTVQTVADICWNSALQNYNVRTITVTAESRLSDLSNTDTTSYPVLHKTISFAYKNFYQSIKQNSRDQGTHHNIVRVHLSVTTAGIGCANSLIVLMNRAMTYKNQL